MAPWAQADGPEDLQRQEVADDPMGSVLWCLDLSVLPVSVLSALSAGDTASREADQA